MSNELSRFESARPIVLALPRGGVPVGYEVAERLHAPLDVLIVRKLGTPGHREVAMGAIADGGALVLRHDILRLFHVEPAELESESVFQKRELLRRAALYRGDLPPLNVRDRTTILVDDGLATGATMQVAVEALRKLDPLRVIVAVPIAAPDACELLSRVADETICAETPRPFRAVGDWYEDFEQTSDREVIDLLGRARRELELLPQRRRTG